MFMRNLMVYEKVKKYYFSLWIIGDLVKSIRVYIKFLYFSLKCGGILIVGIILSKIGGFRNEGIWVYF